VIQFTSVTSSNGVSQFVTVIGLDRSSSGVSTVNFCGDVRSQFSQGVFTTMKFTQTPNCANLVAITTG
jgi:hypothetical protein